MKRLLVTLAAGFALSAPVVHAHEIYGQVGTEGVGTGIVFSPVSRLTIDCTLFHKVAARMPSIASGNENARSALMSAERADFASKVLTYRRRRARSPAAESSVRPIKASDPGSGAAEDTTADPQFTI